MVKVEEVLVNSKLAHMKQQLGGIGNDCTACANQQVQPVALVRLVIGWATVSLRWQWMV